MPNIATVERRQLLLAMEEAFNRKAWHGTNLLGSFRGIQPAAAAWRPGPGRHNIWEIIVHAAYWKYAVLRRITGGKRGGFALKGSNWFPRPQVVSARALSADIALLKRSHAELLEAAEEISPSGLRRRPAGGRYTVEAMLRGIAAHDVYHAGQIQLLKRLRARRA